MATAWKSPNPLFRVLCSPLKSLTFPAALLLVIPTALLLRVYSFATISARTVMDVQLSVPLSTIRVYFEILTTQQPSKKYSSSCLLFSPTAVLSVTTLGRHHTRCCD